MFITKSSRFCFNRNVAAILASAALTAIGGCASNNSDDPRPMDSSAAVTTPEATHSQTTTSQLNTTRYFPSGDRANSVLMVQAMGPQSVRLQKQVTYQMKVTNLLDMPLKNVVVSSTNPGGFQTTAVTGSTTKPSDGDRLEYALGDLSPKESRLMTVTGMGTKVGSVDTCYSVHYNPPTLCTEIQVVSPALTLAVQVPADNDICKALVYHYTVSNTGTGTARNVMLQETLPDGLMTTDGKQTVMANIGDIPQGQSRTTTAQLKASRTGRFTGQAMAESEGDKTPMVDTATAIHAPALTLVVKGAASDYVGKQVAYHITVTNTGDAIAKNAKLQVGHAADGMGVIAAEGLDANGMLALGDLAPNASRTIDANVSSSKGGSVVVTANTTADCAAAVSGRGETMFNTIPALLLETVDEADPVRVGENVIYDIKVTNQGTGADSNVNVKAIIPDGEQYVSTDGPTQPTGDTTLTFPSIPTLQPKQSVTWKVTVKAVKAQDVQFKTSATSDGVKAAAEKTEPTKLY